MSNLDKILNPHYIELLAEIGVPKERNVVELEYKKRYKRIIFLSAAQGKRAAKKRYMGIDEKGEVDEVGIEAVRSDSCFLQKKVQRACGNMMLKDNPINKDKIVAYIVKVREDLLKGKVPLEDLVISKGLQKKLSEYKANTPHRRVAEQMLKSKSGQSSLNGEDENDGEEEVSVGDKIQYLVKGYDGKIIAVPYSKNVNMNQSAFQYYWSNHIRPVLERLLIAIFKKEELDSILEHGKAMEQKEL